MLTNLRLAASVSMVLALVLTSTAHSQDCVAANWWANKTSYANVYEMFPEWVRLDNSTDGYIEGSVQLPAGGEWEIIFGFHTDETFDIPTEYSRMTINGVVIGTYYNTPGGAVISYGTTPVTGNSFTYRFDYFSPSPIDYQHMVTRRAYVRRRQGECPTYCVGGPNSVGVGARISCTGQASLSTNDLVLHAMALPPGNVGLFFYGPGSMQMPFGDGYLCVNAPLFRLGPMITTSGELTVRALDLTSLPAVSGQGQITVGSTWYFQLWYSDPAAGGSGFNTTDAMAATFQP